MKARYPLFILLALALLTAPAFALANSHGGGGDDHGDRHDGRVHGLVKNLTASPDCTLAVPDHPLTAQGLATPYELGSAGQTCSETDNGVAAFVQATILDPRTGSVAVYNPVVKDAGQPLLGAAPPVPQLPRDAVITIWTGFNGNVLKLTGDGADRFVNFAQQAYANSGNFFRELRRAEYRGLVSVPALGMASDGQACPSSRDFSIVDQDQSDNNVEGYPAYGVKNGSDEGTLNTVDKILGCSTWQAPLISGTGTTSSGPLQEEQAADFQQAPVALVPGLDPFVTVNGQPNLHLQNLYRKMVGQPRTHNGADTAAYCQNLAGTGEPRLKLDAAAEAVPSPSPALMALGDTVAHALANRFVQTWQNLGCAGTDPITVTLDGNGIATGAAYA